MYGYIYKTTNLLNNKIYIGQKKSEKFLGEKYLGSGVRLNSAIKHYGKSNFIVELIDVADSKVDLDEKEVYWINKLNSRNLDIGYNLSLGGDGNKGTPAWNKGLNRQTYPNLCHSLETRAKMSKIHLGHICSEETRLKISSSNKGKKRTLEQNKANSFRNKNKAWIKKGNIQKTVSLEELNFYLSQGWEKGRLKNKVPAWNKGLTKESDPRVNKYAESRKQNSKNR